MPKLAIIIGTLLVALGIISYTWATDLGAATRSPTALIPCFFGIVIATTGAMALNPAMRKHAMHAAVTVALVGMLASLGRYLTHMAPPTTIAPASQLLMALLCGVFVAMGVRSFIQARRDREAIENR